MPDQCNCNLCKRSRKYREHLERVSAEDKSWWEGIYERLCMVEEDNDYLESLSIPRLKERIAELEANQRNS